MGEDRRVSSETRGMPSSRGVPSGREPERRSRSMWLPDPAVDDSSVHALPPGLMAGTTGRWRISFFEAVMLGVVGGAVGGGILGGLNASGAVDTVLTVEFGAVFGILVGIAIAVLLTLASRLLTAHGRRQSAAVAITQGAEPGSRAHPQRSPYEAERKALTHEDTLAGSGLG
jgi:hypothetical protein